MISAFFFRRSPKRSLLVCFDFLRTLKSLFYLCFFTGLPVNGSIYSTNDIWSYSRHLYLLCRLKFGEDVPIHAFYLFRQSGKRLCCQLQLSSGGRNGTMSRIRTQQLECHAGWILEQYQKQYSASEPLMGRCRSLWFFGSTTQITFSSRLTSSMVRRSASEIRIPVPYNTLNNTG